MKSSSAPCTLAAATLLSLWQGYAFAAGGSISAVTLDKNSAQANQPVQVKIAASGGKCTISVGIKDVLGNSHPDLVKNALLGKTYAIANAKGTDSGYSFAALPGYGFKDLPPGPVTFMVGPGPVAEGLLPCAGGQHSATYTKQADMAAQIIKGKLTGISVSPQSAKPNEAITVNVAASGDQCTFVLGIKDALGNSHPNVVNNAFLHNDYYKKYIVANAKGKDSGYSAGSLMAAYFKDIPPGPVTIMVSPGPVADGILPCAGGQHTATYTKQVDMADTSLGRITSVVATPSKVAANGKVTFKITAEGGICSYGYELVGPKSQTVPIAGTTNSLFNNDRITLDLAGWPGGAYNMNIVPAKGLPNTGDTKACMGTATTAISITKHEISAIEVPATVTYPADIAAKLQGWGRFCNVTYKLHSPQGLVTTAVKLGDIQLDSGPYPVSVATKGLPGDGLWTLTLSGENCYGSSLPERSTKFNVVFPEKLISLDVPQPVVISPNDLTIKVQGTGKICSLSYSAREKSGGHMTGGSFGQVDFGTQSTQSLVIPGKNFAAHGFYDLKVDGKTCAGNSLAPLAAAITIAPPTKLGTITGVSVSPGIATVNQNVTVTITAEGSTCSFSLAIKDAFGNAYPDLAKKIMLGNSYGLTSQSVLDTSSSYSFVAKPSDGFKDLPPGPVTILVGPGPVLATSETYKMGIVSFANIPPCSGQKSVVYTMQKS